MIMNFFNIRFVRFFIVGLFSVVLEMATLIILVELAKVQYLISNVFAFTLTNIFNYSLSRKWVFERSGMRKRVEFPFFLIFVSIGLLINQLVLWYCVDKLLIDYRLGKLVSIAIVIAWNFLTRKHLVFNSSNVIVKGMGKIFDR